MERRSWSWKKKVERIASTRFNNDSSQSEDFKQNMEEPVQVRTSTGLRDQFKASDSVTQAEIKLRILSEQLMARDELVQQHAKVAEEAVTGWEKAECEAACYKQQLDEEILNKVAIEDRVVHLDQALKDCMRQLRHAQDQELKLYEAVAAKTQQLEELHSEMESTMSKFVDERARAAKEADAKSRAEEKASVLQMRMEMAEKEQAKWKYELHVLSKELDIRNEELEFSKKAAEATSKQHLENVKRNAKLEGECQRLRLLLCQRFPGSATIAQTRMEVEALPTFERASHTSASSRFTEFYMDSSPSDASQELTNRLLATEDENKSLREALIKKDGELQSARFMCAKTVCKLSAAQENLEKALPPRPHNIFHRSTRSAIDGYASSLEQALLLGPEDGVVEDESNRAESWASALISELAQIRKDKGDAVAQTSVHLSSSHLMDDFAEMERLASMPFENHAKVLGAEIETIDVFLRPTSQNRLESFSKAKDFEETIKTEGDKLKSLNSLCTDLRTRLTCAENELNATKLENFATKAALWSIEKRLIALLQGETEGKTQSDIFEEVRAALDTMSKHLTDSVGPSYALCHGMESPEVRDTRAWSPSGQSSCQSEEVTFKQDIRFPSKKNHAGSELFNAVHKVVCLFGELPQLGFSETHSVSDVGDALANSCTGKLWRSSEFESCIRSLIILCDGVLLEKVDINDFLEEIASALEWLVSHIFSLPDKLPETHGVRRRLEFSRSSAIAGITSMAYLKEESTSCVLQESVIGPEQHKKPHNPLSPKEVHATNYGNRNQCIEEQLTQLKIEKEEIDTKLTLMTKDLELLKSLLQNSDSDAIEMPKSPMAALDKKQSFGNDVADHVASQRALKSQPSAAREAKKGVRKPGSQEEQLQGEAQCSREMEGSFQQQQVWPSMLTVVDKKESTMSMEEVTTKEEEFGGYTEKLAECQQTILVLGKQLQALEMPQDRQGLGYASQKSEHSSIKPLKAQQRVHSSSDKLQSISENSGTFEDLQRNLGQFSHDMSMGYAMISPDYHHKDSNFTASSPRDLVMGSLARSPRRFLRSRGDIKSDSSAEKHATGLSRFFSKKYEAVTVSERSLRK